MQGLHLVLGLTTYVVRLNRCSSFSSFMDFFFSNRQIAGARRENEFMIELVDSGGYVERVLSEVRIDVV